MNHSFETLQELHELLKTPGIRDGNRRYCRLMLPPKGLHTYGTGLTNVSLTRLKANDDPYFTLALGSIDDSSWVIHLPPGVNTDQHFFHICDLLDNMSFECWDHAMFEKWAIELGGFPDFN